MPAFSYRHIKDLYPVFWSKSVEMVKMIEQDLTSRTVEDNVVQVGDWASRTTLDIIGVAGMGCDFEALKRPENALHQSYKTLVSQPLSEKLLFLLGVLSHPRYTLNIPTARNREIKKCNTRIRSAARQIIQQRKAEKGNAGTGIDIISVALQSGLFVEESLIDQAMTFLGAGHDTTAASLQWSIYALCKYPGIQTKLREEVRAHLPAISGAHPEQMTAPALDNLPYLSAFCNEVIRFYPAVPKTVRRAVQATTVVGKYIPEGTLIVLAPEVINHMAELWGPDSDKFDPQRFLNPGKANTGGAASNYANMSFLHGPRSCIAQGFAKAELACLVAAMVGRFQMVLKYPDAELQTRETLTLVPADGVLARLTPLEGW
jgi:cytochrome P450